MKRPATSVVEYGPTTTYGSSASSPGFVTAHSVGLAGLSCGTLYHYRIGSLDGAQNLALSGDGVFTTGLCADTKPPVISQVGAAPAQTSVAISWATDEAATSAIDVGLTTAYGATVSDPTFVLSHSLSAGGLLCNRLYHYRVRSSDGSGNAAASADATFQTSACQTDTTPPLIGTVGATASSSDATISWTTDEPSTSRVDYGATTTYGSFATSPGLVSSHTVGLTGLACGALHHYRVSSTDAAGNPAASADAVFTTSACPTGGPVSDDFHAPALDTSRWSFVNPLGDATVSVHRRTRFRSRHALHDVRRAETSRRVFHTTANVDFGQGQVRSSPGHDRGSAQGLIVSRMRRTSSVRPSTTERPAAVRRRVSSTAPDDPPQRPAPGTAPPSGCASAAQERLDRDGRPTEPPFTTAVASPTLTVTRLGPFAGAPEPASGAALHGVDYVFTTASLDPRTPPPDPPALSQIAAALAASSATSREMDGRRFAASTTHDDRLWVVRHERVCRQAIRSSSPGSRARRSTTTACARPMRTGTRATRRTAS